LLLAEPLHERTRLIKGFTDLLFFKRDQKAGVRLRSAT
jgi:hypothetical protein